MANRYTGSDAGRAGLEIKKTTGSPDVRGVTEIQLDTNLTLTDNGNGGVTINSSGGGGGGGTVTSVGLSIPSAFSVSGSPITTTGTLALTGAGTTSQFIDGTGALQTVTTGTIEGSIAVNQIAVGTAADTIGGSSSLTFSGALGLNMNTGANDAIVNLSSSTKSISLKVASNMQLTIEGSTHTFVFDASTATGGITWPDGTIQTTAAVSGVTSIVAGTNISISPVGGTGAVTINSSGGGGLGTVTDIRSSGPYIQTNPLSAITTSGDLKLFISTASIAPGLGGGVEGYNFAPPDDTGAVGPVPALIGQGWIPIPGDIATTGSTTIYIPYWIPQ
jgi:hypothetical protein